MKMRKWTKGLAVLAGAALMAGAAPSVAYAHHGHCAAPVYADCYQDGVCTGDGCCDANGVCLNGGSCIVTANQGVCITGHHLGRGHRAGHHH